jgi:hypothetical protein
MTDSRTSEALRQMVREVLSEVLPRDAEPAPRLPSIAPEPRVDGADVRRVRVQDDRDLADVVTQVLRLAEDPARVADLKAGRIRFALVTGDATPATPAPGPIEVERGAVTERLIQRAAREQRPLRLGPRAVVTPLARDRARALGVALDRSSADNRRETR